MTSFSNQYVDATALLTDANAFQLAFGRHANASSAAYGDSKLVHVRAKGDNNKLLWFKIRLDKVLLPYGLNQFDKLALPMSDERLSRFVGWFEEQVKKAIKSNAQSWFDSGAGEPVVFKTSTRQTSQGTVFDVSCKREAKFYDSVGDSIECNRALRGHVVDVTLACEGLRIVGHEVSTRWRYHAITDHGLSDQACQAFEEDYFFVEA